MLETIVSLVALVIACLALYRATRRQLPTIDFFASRDDPFDPNWRIQIHNPTRSPVYLLRITIHEPSPDMVPSIWHKNTSVHGTVERSLKELEAAEPGSGQRRVRETHLRIAPGGTEDLFVDIAAGDETGGDPTPYNIKLGLEWSHELPFPDAWLFGLLHRRIAKCTAKLEALRLAARPSS